MAIAQQERVDAVSTRHVDDAYQALARVGLRVAPWYKRTEVEAAVGGMLVSFSLASPDIVGVFIPGASGLRHRKSATTTTDSIDTITLGYQSGCI